MITKDTPLEEIAELTLRYISIRIKAKEQGFITVEELDFLDEYDQASEDL